MFIDGLVNSGSIPGVEAAAQFAGRRQGLIAHNIANISTPNFQQKEVDVEGFQSMLAEAVNDRRRRRGLARFEFNLKGNREVNVQTGPMQQNQLSLNPRSTSDNILFHDRNNRDLERLMQDLAENASAFRVATDVFKSRLALLNQAIALRV